MAAFGTRKKLYLFEEYENDIKGLKLPSNKQVLSNFFQLHQQHDETVSASARQAVEKVKRFWAKANIPTREQQQCILHYQVGKAV